MASYHYDSIGRDTTQEMRINGGRAARAAAARGDRTLGMAIIYGPRGGLGKGEIDCVKEA